jgi:hypothetical protein
MKELDYSEEKIDGVSVTATQIGWRGRKRSYGRRERKEGGSRDVCPLSTSCFAFICSQTAVSADFSVCAFLFISFVSSLLFYSIYFGVFCSVK